MPCLSWSATRWNGRAFRINNRAPELALIKALGLCPKRWSSVALVTCSPPDKPAGACATIVANIWDLIVRPFDLHPDVNLGSTSFWKLEYRALVSRGRKAAI
jgi:hypothetical protein